MRRRVVLSLVGIVLIIGAAVWFAVLPSWMGSRVLTTEEGNGYSATLLHVHDRINITYYFQNRTDTSLTVTGVTLEHALPSHLKVLGQSILSLSPGEGEPFIFTRGQLSTRERNSLILHPVHDFRILPHAPIHYVLTLESDAPGAFTIQGVTLHANYPLPIGALPVQVTNIACTQLGVGLKLSDPVLAREPNGIVIRSVLPACSHSA